MSDSPIRVMVVDDERAVRTLHGRYLAETPGFVVAASVDTGEAAVARAAQGDIDLMLLDMQLPGISGVEVLQQLYRLMPHPPSVIVLSSARDAVTVRQALSARVVGYLVKPFTAEVLRERLREFRSSFAPMIPAERPRPLAQSEIDRMLNRGDAHTGPAVNAGSVARSWQLESDAGGLPKGLAPQTLARVLDQLDSVTPVSVLQLAEACEISRPTARRYLEYLVDRGRADVSHRYGRRGRPEVLYRLAAG
ncbi:response regulator [Leucobacter insecticola]|uniref:Response regulator n=1 Tax=Leucobacter insecticola TaxID=2714934 RepID=A0A6G8FLG6_9MICO|nr:response regulator [Leucobacter insecticola]